MQGISDNQGAVSDIYTDCPGPESNVSGIKGKQGTDRKLVAKTEATDADNAMCPIGIRARNLQAVRPDHSILNESVLASGSSACKEPVTDVEHNRSLNDVRQQILGLLLFFNGKPMSDKVKAKLAALMLYKSMIEVLEKSEHSGSIIDLAKKISGVLSGCAGYKEDEMILGLWKLSANNRLKWVDGNESVRGFNSIDSLIISLNNAVVELQEIMEKYMDPSLQFLCANGFPKFCKKVQGDDIFESIKKIEHVKDKIKGYIQDYELFKQERRYLDRVKEIEKLMDTINDKFVIRCDDFLAWLYLAQEVNSTDAILESQSRCRQMGMGMDDKGFSDVGLTLSSLESKILAAYLLYKEDNHGSVDVNIGQRIALYFDQLQDEFNDRVRVIDEHQYKILLSILVQNLGRFINKLNCHKILSKPVKAKGKRSGKQFIANVFDTELKMAIKLLLLMIQNNALHLVGFSGIKSIISAYLPNFKAGDSNHKIILNAIRDEMLKKANKKHELVVADFHAICFSELNKDVDAFNIYLEKTSKNSLVALLIIVTNNLGLIKWPYTTVNPDQAVDYLISLKNKSDELSLIRPLMNQCYDFCMLISVSSVVPEVWSVRLAIYFYLVGEADKGNKIVSSCKLPADKFYPALEKVANQDYLSAIVMLDDQLNQRGSAKALNARIKMLLAVLYERFSDSQEEIINSAGFHVDKLEKAISFLKKVVSTRPELQKNLARVYEKSGDLQQSLSCWEKYRNFLKCDFENSSKQCPSRYSNDVELMLVDEKVQFLKETIIRNVSIAEETAGSSMDNDKMLPDWGKGKKTTMTWHQLEHEPVYPIDVQGNKNSSEDSLCNLSDPGKNKPVTAVVALSGRCTEKSDRIAAANFSGAGTADADSGFTIDISEQSGMILADSDDTDWQLVGRKEIKKQPSTLQEGPVIPYELTEVAVTAANRKSFRRKCELNDRFLNLDCTEKGYEDLMMFIDKHIEQSSNPLIKSHFIQNKEWLLRMKSFNSGVMIVESRRDKCSVNQTKLRIRCDILDIGKGQLRQLYRVGCKTPSDYKGEDSPERLQSKELRALLERVCLSYKVQFGSHAATIAHTLNDIVSDARQGLVSSTEVKELYQRTTEDCHSLASDYYGFRDFVNPEHKSDVI